MKHYNNTYIADDGQFFVRKEDGLIMGKTLILGIEDTISNYIERPYTDEEYITLYGAE